VGRERSFSHAIPGVQGDLSACRSYRRTAVAGQRVIGEQAFDFEHKILEMERF
jgi:hypothetical protein